MDIGQAKSLVYPRKRRDRVGRGLGSGHGKTSRRGHNGARSRSGWSSRGMVGGRMALFRRLPKVGFTNAPFRTDYTIINVGELNTFPAGSRVTQELLEQQGILKQVSPDGVKVLGDGELDRPLAVCANAFSRSAREKIQAAGGTVELIAGPQKPVRHKMRPRKPPEVSAEA